MDQGKRIAIDPSFATLDGLDGVADGVITIGGGETIVVTAVPLDGTNPLTGQSCAVVTVSNVGVSGGGWVGWGSLTWYDAGNPTGAGFGAE